MYFISITFISSFFFEPGPDSFVPHVRPSRKRTGIVFYLFPYQWNQLLPKRFARSALFALLYRYPSPLQIIELYL